MKPPSRWRTRNSRSPAPQPPQANPLPAVPGNTNRPYAVELAERATGFLAFLQTFLREPEPDDEVVHDLRVAGRRLGTALLLAKPVLPRGMRRLRRRVRDTIRLFNPLRDLHVAQLRHGVDPAHTDNRDWHAAALQIEKEIRGRIPGALPRRAMQRLEKLADPVRCMAVPQAAPDEVQPLVQSRTAMLTARFFDMAAGMPSQPTDTMLHQLRIAGKKMRYALEIAHMPARSRASILKTCKGLQDMLGAIHDASVIEGRCAADPAPAGAPDLKDLFARLGAMHTDAPGATAPAGQTCDALIAGFLAAWPPPKFRRFRAQVDRALGNAP